MTRTALLLFILLILLLLFVYFSQRSRIYFPIRADAQSLARQATKEGLMPWFDQKGRQIGWQTGPQESGSLPVLIFHGNAGHALHHSTLVARLQEAGISSPIFLLEYPGFGARPGKPTEKSLVAAAVEAMETLTGPILLVGQSLGTGVACAATVQRPERVKGLLLITPFDSLVTVAGTHYPWAPVSLLLLDRYDSAAALKKFRGPLAIVLAEGDTVTTAAAAKSLYESYNGPKKLWAVPESGHNQVIWDLSSAQWRAAYDFACGR